MAPLQEVDRDQIMYLDDWEDWIDGDPEVTETVDAMFQRLRSYDVVKLDFYRRMMKEYRGWKPMTLKDYALHVQSSQIQIIKRELDKARQATNDRIKRQTKDKT